MTFPNARAWLGLGLISCIASVASAAVPSAAGLSDNLAYDQAYWSRPHNPYETAQFSNLLDVLNRGNRVVELDVWESGGQLVVKHNGTDGDYANNCNGGSGGSFADCLNDLVSWSNSHPNHLPITLQIDLKAGLLFGWDSGARSQLNSQLSQTLGSRIFTPEELRQFTGNSSLRLGVLNNGWPTIGSLRGQFLVMLTGGPISQKNQTQRAYIEQFGNQAQALVCPQAEDPIYFDAYGSAKDFSGYAANNWVVCGNTENLKYWSKTVEASALNRQVINIWSSDNHHFDAYHNAYIAVASGVSMISRETLDSYGNRIPLNGERRSIPNRFRLQAEHSGQCLDVAGASYADGSDIHQWNCHDGVNQVFRYSDETQLRAVGNEEYCFDIDGGQSVAGKGLHLWDCDGGDSEKWRLTTSGELVGIGNRCAAVPGNSQQNGTQAELANCSGGANQRFNLLPY
ncbi:Ca2+-dependent phosphoinositide-specific phospholipase C [Saccharospirillum sp. HFRX-1]|uniref:Ca2+-dependent phosphoinositide-specific phospholipase C n=1 Tax=unclassified Saccharospirillum TaxID=2633430 RepID=UPI003719C1F1